MCNEMHPLCGSLPVPHLPVRVTRGAVIVHRYTSLSLHLAAEPLQYRRTFIALSVSQWNDLGDPEFDGVGCGRFQDQG